MNLRLVARVGAAAVAVGGLVVAQASAAGAGTPSATSCSGSLTGVLAGNVLVPPGATCYLVDAIVVGNIDVEGGASLYTDYQSGVEHVTVDGNVAVDTGASLSADGITTVKGNFSSVGGSDILKNITVLGNLSVTGSPAGLSGLKGGSIGGNAFFGSDAFIVEAGTTFGRNVSYSANTSVVVVGGMVAGNLSCSGNGSVADTFLGLPPFPITVVGNASGQCAPPISQP
jgi:hypothetical protein